MFDTEPYHDLPRLTGVSDQQPHLLNMFLQAIYSDTDSATYSDTDSAIDSDTDSAIDSDTDSAIDSDTDSAITVLYTVL